MTWRARPRAATKPASAIVAIRPSTGEILEAVRATGCAEIPSNEVGLAILGPLRELDQVAYLRFASVYKSFDSLDEFEKEIRALREATVARETAVRHAVAARSGGRAPKIADPGRTQ